MTLSGLSHWLVRTQRTAQRLKRTLLQVMAGGAFGGLFSALVLGRKATEAIASALATAGGAFLAAWAQNSLEDSGRVKDRREG